MWAGTSNPPGWQKGDLGEVLGWLLQMRDPVDVDLKGWWSS